ncbi:MAG: tetraacyldisaccharide 4'-kinase [Burkholderiaceae bacterium]|nr:tetraacyldisaccharide 4'-kinase [Burkholderiaceae bacterium]
MAAPPRQQVPTTSATGRLRERIEPALRTLWYERSPSRTLWLLRAALAPLAALTAAVARRRRHAIRRLPAPAVPVVVVGNLVAGGAGKTPLVEALVDALAQRGWTPGIVTSGYGARRHDARLVGAGDDAIEHGDEPVLLARRTGRPVAAARARRQAVQTLLAAQPSIDVVVSDDGLQHAGLARSVEIAVFDERGAGNGRCLPAGPLRAPLAQAASMDAIALNGQARPPLAHQRVFGFRIEPLHFVALDGHAAPVPAGEFASRLGSDAVVALAATGAPQRFFDTLRTLGVDAEEIALADHASISPARLDAIAAPWILMTEKDAVKCATWADARCWYLEVRALVEPALADWLNETLHGRTPARDPRLSAVQGAAEATARRPLR